MNKIKVINPLCESYSIKKIDEFDVDKILEGYNAMNIDVSRFFNKLNQIDLFECCITGYRFYYPFSSIGDADFYKDLSLNRKNYYSIRWEHHKVLDGLNKNESVLEIGSGFGAFLNLLKTKGIRAEGIELNPEAISNCENQGLKIHNQLIEDFALNHREKYHIVCCFQVLEHITNVHEFVENSLLTLRPNGKLIIGVPNNNPFLFVNDKFHTLNLPPHHAGLWDENSLKLLGALFNLKLESTDYEPLEKTYSQFLKSYIKNSRYVYSKGLLLINKIAPKVLKWVLCKFINGRNILVVFRKR